nr:unnamed protein product [Amyelois transitella]
MEFPGIECNTRYNQCCKCCKTQCNRDFRKVLELKNSGLVVYIHQRCEKKKEEMYDAVILFNTTDKHFKRSTFLSELGRQNVKCIPCQNIIHRVQNLLTEIKCIKGNETIGICDYCKRANISNCKRCEYVVNKFMTLEREAESSVVQYVIAWVRRVMICLQSSLEVCINKHNLYVRDTCVEELQRLLNDLDLPLATRQPDYLKNLVTTIMNSLQGILEDFLNKYKFNTKEESLEDLERLLHELKPPTIRKTSICPPNIEIFPIVEEIKSLSNLKVTELLQNLLSTHKNESETPSRDSHISTTSLLKKSKDKNISSVKKPISMKREIVREGKHRKKIVYDETISEKKTEITKKKIDKKTIKRNIPKVDDKNKKGTSGNIGKLTSKKSSDKYSAKDKKVDVQRNEKSVEESMMARIMQKETTSVRYFDYKNESDHKGLDKRHNLQQDSGFKIPLLYHVHKTISSHSLPNKFSPNENIVRSALPALTPPKTYDRSMEVDGKGVIKYQLSDPEYITKGWTQLPNLRIMRRMDIYRMKPVNAGNNWFQRNKKTTMSYNDSEEILADIDGEGYGKLFYKNGKVALHYYKAKEPNVAYRYVVYSDGEPKNGISKPVTVLGVFDGIGNGVVYNSYGKERLKYNQSEGMLMDKTIDSPCKWKWHTLNDPPVLQPVFFDTFYKDSPVRTILQPDVEISSDNSKKKNPDMLAINLENLLKEKSDKQMQKLKPLEIKSKALKLNQQFSLRILQQKVIYLIFREGKTFLKFNLGLSLVSNEITGTESQDVENLFTSYDSFPPRSESVENIQQILGTARKLKKCVI